MICAVLLHLLYPDHDAATARELGCVVEQVGNHFVHPGLVGVDNYWLWRGFNPQQHPGWDRVFCVPCDVLDLDVHVKRLPVQFDRATLYARNFKDVGRQALKPARVADDKRHVILCHRYSILAVELRFDDVRHAEYRLHRRPDFVRGNVYKFDLHAVEHLDVFVKLGLLPEDAVYLVQREHERSAV